MRELKFRAWDKTVSKRHMIYVNWKWLGERAEHISDYVLMQFTGLKDNNGKEIYEGDVIHQIARDAEDETYVSKGVIEWLYDGFSIKLRDKMFADIRNYGNNIEVIGNIYENKELLQ